MSPRYDARRTLTDILNGGSDALRGQWQSTEAAAEFTPLPPGAYTARIIAGELHTAKSGTPGTPGYKLTFRVLDGEHTGKRFWHNLWLTPAALPMAKRDLAKLGITTLDQLEAPLPPGIRCVCKLVLRCRDDGSGYNQLRAFEVIEVDDDPTADADFAPPPRPNQGVPMTADALLGFRLVGPTTGERRLVDWHQAFAAYCAADARAGVEHEGYLSAFTFGGAFRDHLHTTGSTKGYAGICSAAWLWWDLDRIDNLDAALRDARMLCGHLLNAYALDDDALLIFFSGSKGFHVGLPTAGFTPEPGPLFHRTARRFAEHAALAAGVTLDTGVYDRVRAFRAPNSRHPKTGRHKRRLALDELLHLGTKRLIELGAKPEPFDVPTEARVSGELSTAWDTAAVQVHSEARADALWRRDGSNGDARARLNRSTFDFIRDGASTGHRHRLLFSAAANLAQCGAPEHLCRELLTEAALDSGLPPAQVARQIRCGVEHAAHPPAIACYRLLSPARPLPHP